MVGVKKEGIIIQKTDLLFENEGVLNPAVIKEGNEVHLFYRAVSNGNYSSIGYCQLRGPLTIVKRNEEPILFSEYDYETHGVEDPRIVKIDAVYYLTYTAFDGVNALGALALSEDLVHWEKKGLIVPQISYEEFDILTDDTNSVSEKYFRYNNHEGIVEKEGKKVLLWDKNVIFFPRRINGFLFFFHRIKPDIQIVVSIKDFEELTPEFWKNYLVHLKDYIVLVPKFEHESSYVGGGCPPIETGYGWLIIYPWSSRHY